MSAESAPSRSVRFVSRLKGNTMSDSMVQVRNVTKVYERGKQEKVEVLHGLALDIPKGDFCRTDGVVRARARPRC